MASLIIEVFENEKPDVTFKIPLLVLQIAAKLIPRKAFQALESEGINIQDVINAAKSGEISGQLIEVVDHKDNERIVISVA
ncbi:hypothetical protein [Chitinolyticbacter albus]|uniref:hypothetical protein n=1 Tax=Chitinolyticbacter albus TaxID=2961951 RepID=UPI00210D1ABD|nr:hypothetical protein [Chitinolyticbacter albus]